MKSKMFFTALLAMAALVPVKAQVKSEKIELPPDQVIKHFRAYNSGTVVVDWRQVEDENNTYIIGTYTLDGDHKKVIYRDMAHYCSETQIPLNYCPAKLKAAADTLAAGYTLKELYYQSAGRDRAYRAVMQKGKGKKAVTRDLLFNAKSDFLREEKPENTRIHRL
ncbi:MAG: hypothetical protein NC048_01335 [Bacteroides sp.]|nr:hypothetical protein [Ruminococcus flavefaciens]MCM1554123.1 hypothetical protein [Bacteroides sp.]